MRVAVVFVVVGLAVDLAHASPRSPDWDLCAGRASASPQRTITACTAIIERNVNPRHEISIAYGNRGVAYATLGDFKRAIEDLNRAIEINGRSAVAFNNRCNVHSDMGDYDRAIADCTRAIELDGRFSEAYNNRGLVYSRKGDYDRAIADFDRALRIRPVPATFVNRGTAHLAKGDVRRAIADADRALTFRRRSVNAWRLACRARAVGNIELDRAMEQCNEAVRLTPSAGALEDRALVKFRMGRFSDAIADYDAALALDGALASALYMRGICKLRLGDTAGGSADIGRAKAVDPTVQAKYERYGILP